MAVQTYDTAMVRIFADEGGYTNDPKDPGGPTNFGITIFDARKYWKPNAVADDVKNMPKSVASDIYRKHYATPLRYDDLPAGFDYSVLDAGINSGLGRAVPWMGKALGQPIKTIDEAIPLAAVAPDKVSLIQRYWAIRLAFLQGLKNWEHFGRGWGKRCANGEAAAVRMWLSIGTAMNSVEIRDRMGQEAKKASGHAKRSAGAAAGSAAGSAAPAHPSIDVSQFGLGSKVAAGLFIAALIVLAVYFMRQYVIHNQRAAAYAAF